MLTNKEITATDRGLLPHTMCYISANILQAEYIPTAQRRGHHENSLVSHLSSLVTGGFLQSSVLFLMSYMINDFQSWNRRLEKHDFLNQSSPEES